MNLGAIPVRYAKALYKLASDKGEVDLVFTDIEFVLALFKQNHDLNQFILNPVYSKREKKNLLKTLLPEVNILVIKFLEYVVDKGREAFFERMVLEFRKIHYETEGFIEVKLTSAIPLRENQLEAIKEHVKSVFHRKPIIEAQIDETIIGGFLVMVGNRIYDHTVKTKLDNIKRSLTR